MTIVHTEASDGWGGQEIRTLQEARWMRGQGHRILIFGPRHSEIFKRAQSDGFETRATGFAKANQLMDFISLVRTFRRVRPDVVGTHSNVDSRVGLLAAKAAGVPVTLRYRHVSSPVRGHFMNRWLYGRCDRVLTTAECIRTELIANLRLPPENVTTVPTGIEPPTFAESREQARENLCHRLNLDERTRFIGCVAVLRSWKGQDVLLPAYDQIATQFPNHHLVFAGEGPYRGPLEIMRDQLPSRGRVHFVGHRDDPWPFFRAFDVAVLPSYKDEGIPQSLLQAMFAECAVVGTRTGGIPEIVLDRETGLLATPRSVSDLARALTEALSNRHEAEGRVRNALEMVRNRHTLDRMGETVLRIIQETLRRSIASE